MKKYTDHIDITEAERKRSRLAATAAGQAAMGMRAGGTDSPAPGA